jgi:hypothetical protein
MRGTLGIGTVEIQLGAATSREQDYRAKPPLQLRKGYRTRDGRDSAPLTQIERSVPVTEAEEGEHVGEAPCAARGTPQKYP